MTVFNRIRSRYEGYQAEVNPHHWRLPKSYSTSSKGGKATLIPDPDIFRNAIIPNPSVTYAPHGSLIYPDISHAAVHLALLECFRNMRDSAAELGIKSQAPQLPEYEFAEKPKRSPTFDGETDSEQWNLLIQLAVTRFTTWWSNIEHVFNHATAYTHHAGDQAVVQLNKDYLPPLDVLLVWYSFMLDSEEYAKACQQSSVPDLPGLAFPWPAVRSLIDADTMTLSIPKPAESLFMTLTGQSADILQYINSPPAYTEPFEVPLSIDLVSQVKKQEPFMETSHQLLWIRSPALPGSLDRAVAAYSAAQVTNDLYFLPPASLPFGIDLMWRTHRLYPAQYRSFRQNNSPLLPPGRMDRIQLPTADKKPSASPSTRVCHCWTCERIRDDIPAFSMPPTGPTSSSPSSSTSASASASAPSPAHPLTLPPSLLASIQDDIGFHHAVEAARKHGLPLPTRPPTQKDKEAEKHKKKRRDEARRLPGVNEYIEVSRDGKSSRICVSKTSRPTYGMSMV